MAVSCLNSSTQTPFMLCMVLFSTQERKCIGASLVFI